jgi:hypothetical protein
LATYRFQINSIGRSAGRRATSAAAYRAGDRIRDDRNGRIYNYSRRKDVVHAEIFLPSHLGGAANVWAANREKLWNVAEHTEKRSNSRVAREYEVSLPHELSTAQQVTLARSLSLDLAERYKVAVDLAVHLPRPGSDPRNFHAHLLTTTREVTPRGLGGKTGLDMQNDERRRRALPHSREEIRSLRERWAVLANEALREAKVDARIDHRSLAAQGIDREPTPQFPTAALKMEQRGVRSDVAERIREEYRRRVAARVERAAQGSAAPETLARSNGVGAPAQLKDVDEIRRQAREAWWQVRTQEAGRSAGQSEAGSELDRGGHGPETVTSTWAPDDDLGL